jgi:hypothetical protein
MLGEFLWDINGMLCLHLDIVIHQPFGYLQEYEQALSSDLLL